MTVKPTNPHKVLSWCRKKLDYVKAPLDPSQLRELLEHPHDCRPAMLIATNHASKFMEILKDAYNFARRIGAGEILAILEPPSRMY